MPVAPIAGTAVTQQRGASGGGRPPTTTASAASLRRMLTIQAMQDNGIVRCRDAYPRLVCTQASSVADGTDSRVHITRTYAIGVIGGVWSARGRVPAAARRRLGLADNWAGVAQRPRPELVQGGRRGAHSGTGT